MEHDFLDRYSRMSSPVHRLPASAKLVAALAIVVFLTWVPRGEWVWLQGAAVFLLAVTGLAGLPWGFVIRRLLFARAVRGGGGGHGASSSRTACGCSSSSWRRAPCVS